AGRPRIAPALLTAVDGEDLPGDELARRCRQIDAGLGNIPDITRLPHRIGVRVGLKALRWIVSESRGFEHPGCDAIDADAERCPFPGNGLRQVGDTGARRRGMRDTGHATPEVGDNIDDCTGRAAVDPRLGSGLHHVPGAIEIVVDDGDPALWLEVDGHLRELPAGVVDEYIAATKFAPDIGNIGG